jgi:two-component system cell cycle sensor histidine kinase/response regulator CckA
MHSDSPPVDPNVIDDLGAIIWEAHPTTFQFLFVSRGAEALLGYSVTDWISRPAFWVEVLHPDDRAAAVAECTAAVAEGRDHDFEYRVVAADGSTRWVRDIVSVGCDGTGRVDRLRGVMVDVTKHKALEDARADACRHQEIAVEHSLDMTAITDAAGVIKFVTPSVARVLGVSVEQRLGQSVFDMVHPGDVERMRDLFTMAFDTGEVTVPVQLRYRHADGSWRIVEAVGRTLQDARGAIAVINARDVTDRVQLEAELRQAQKMEALARITSVVAHDFNNLLLVIRGNVDLALDQDIGSDVRPELLEIQKASDLGKAMIAQLMVFSGRKRQMVVVDVHDALRSLRPILTRILARAATLEITLDARQSRVRIEGGALEQLFINLVVNAREAMRGTGEVRIVTRNVREYLEIEVADTGIGMTPEVRDQVFELYFTTKEATRGTGLGLATVYSIVRDAGGSITVDSEPGHGATFRIRLPSVAS